MSEFQHSIVLFTGDDGLPLEFNVRNTKDKAYLKALIEHGGGFCTQNENSVHLISPGTKVLNVDSGKKLVSSSYIFDCVKQNYLLDVNDYVFTISEAQTSDISDEDSERLQALRHSTGKSPKKNLTEPMNIEISPIKAPNNINETGSTTTSNLTLPSSNSALPQISNSSSTHSESFVEGTQDENTNYKITSHIYAGNLLNNLQESSKIVKSPMKLPAGELPDCQNIESQSLVSPLKCAKNSVAAISPLRMPHADRSSSTSPILSRSPAKPMEICDVLTPSKRSVEWFADVSPTVIATPIKPMEVDESVADFPNILQPVNELIRLSTSPVKPANIFSSEHSAEIAQNASPAHTTVSSSQPEDDFDNMLLSKIQKKPQSEDEESLSQSNTVSSSADAQIASKPCSAEIVSPEIPTKNSAPFPDSPSLVSDQINVQLYMKNLEAEIEEILKKEPPLNIQDKTTMVKYICCVRKLPPASVLESLSTDSLDL